MSARFAPPGPPSVRSLRYELGLALAADERVDDAISSLEAALVEHGSSPGDGDIRHELGRLYEGVDITVAFRHHVEAAIAAPERGDVLLAPALRLLESRPSLGSDDVLTELRARIDGPDRTYDGAEAAAAALLGRVALTRRDFDGATQLFERSRTIDPTSAEALAGLAEVARRQGRLGAATALLQDAITAATRSKDHERARRHRAALVDVLIDADDYDAAAATLDALELDGDHDDTTRLARAVVQLARGEAAAASLTASQLASSRLAAAALRVQAQALAIVAVAAGSEGDYAPAEAAARHSAELEASSTDALLVLAQVLIESNAESCVREGLHLLTSVAELLDTDRQLPQVLRRALAYRPQDIDLCFIVATLLAHRSGDDATVAASTAEARRYLDISLANGSLARRSASGVQLVDALLKDRAGDHEGAARARESAAERLRDDQLWADSLVPLRAALEARPIATTGWMLGDSLLMLATSTYPFDQALVTEGTAIWDTALADASPDHDWRWVYLTRGHLASARSARSGRADDGGPRAYWEALCWFETALLADPERTSVWTRIAEAANLGYLYEYGIDALEGALRYSPNEVASIAEHAALLVNTGRVDASLEAVARARATGDTLASEVYLVKIESFCRTLQRDYEAALELVDRALAASPSDQWSAFSRFWIRRKLEHDSAAEDLALIERILADDPANHNGHANLLLLQGRFADALDRLDQLDDLAFRDPNTLGTKMLCLASLGRADHRDALGQLERCTRYVPEVSSVADHSIPWLLDHVDSPVATTMLERARDSLLAVAGRLSTARTFPDDLASLHEEAERSGDKGAWGRLLVTLVRARLDGWTTPDLAGSIAELPVAGRVLCARYGELLERRAAALASAALVSAASGSAAPAATAGPADSSFREPSGTTS